MKYKFANSSEKVSFDFRNLPTPMVRYSGTAKELHQILFDASLSGMVKLGMLDALRAVWRTVHYRPEYKEALDAVERAIAQAEGK